MPRIVINNVNELKEFKKRVQVLKASLPFIQKMAVQKVANEDVLEEIHQRMRQNNFSEKIIDATFVGPTTVQAGISTTHFISNYVADNGFDVSEAREEGTRTHDVRPKKPDGVLRWIGKAGEIIFRKKSRPKGIERLLIIEKTLKEKENTVSKEVGEVVGKEAAKIMGV